LLLGIGSSLQAAGRIHITTAGGDFKLNRMGANASAGG